LNGKNVTLWHSSSGLHTPRAEDGVIPKAGPNNGMAIVYWTSFELRPRNLFVKTPLYRLPE
jgi:Cu2+-containing amine oxidase